MFMYFVQVLLMGFPSQFVRKTYEMVDDPSTDLIVSWSLNRTSFVVWDHRALEKDVLPKYFRHNNFSSFIRQLNVYGFSKVDPERWEFAHGVFQKGQKHLLKNIKRRKPSSCTSALVHLQDSQGMSSSNGSTDTEAKKSLKDNKNKLMEELAKLRQEQQNMEQCFQFIEQRLDLMEQLLHQRLEGMDRQIRDIEHKFGEICKT
ncbi:hypothetical protein MKW94_003050 [Papaver nudicaule]|uniref:HSF-type DNA-binding domain-containing protein n=1 Tax=Papaver nudicaule TaxID=74823 RepID=A0AA41VX05_PAPNU|nr:hypothetical protein [Papaver nudicaule]MCL7049042.1 hypothetical protein [Papaver nudicaule]